MGKLLVPYDDPILQGDTLDGNDASSIPTGGEMRMFILAHIPVFLRSKWPLRKYYWQRQELEDAEREWVSKGGDPLVSLSPEELSKVPPLTDRRIKKALEQGRKEREAYDRNAFPMHRDDGRRYR